MPVRSSVTNILRFSIYAYKNVFQLLLHPHVGDKSTWNYSSVWSCFAVVPVARRARCMYSQSTCIADWAMVGSPAKLQQVVGCSHEDVVNILNHRGNFHSSLVYGKRRPSFVRAPYDHAQRRASSTVWNESRKFC